MSRPARIPSRQSEGPVRSEASRIAILAAAQRVLDEVGAENFTIEAVAREARASKPTIYKWWGDKQSLLGEVYRIATPITAGHRVSGTTVHDELVSFYNNLWSFWRDKSNADTTRWLMRSALASDQATETYREDYLAARTAPVENILKRGRQSGEIPLDADIVLASDLLLGFHMIYILTGRVMNPDVIEAGVSAVLQGALSTNPGQDTLRVDAF